MHRNKFDNAREFNYYIDQEPDQKDNNQGKGKSTE